MGVERIFPLHATIVDHIDVTKRGRVRRAKLYYLRELRGKAARIRERIRAGNTQRVDSLFASRNRTQRTQPMKFCVFVFFAATSVPVSLGCLVMASAATRRFAVAVRSAFERQAQDRRSTDCRRR